MAIEFLPSPKLDEAGEAFLESNWKLVDAGMEDSRGLAVTALDGDRIIGVVKGWGTGGVAYVSELMVGPDHRGKGLGADLLRHFEQECRNAGTLRLALRVRKGDPAQRFYEREGWAVELSVPDWLGGHTYLQMRKDL